MPEPQLTHLQCQIEQGVLVVTISETQLQDEKLANAILQELLGLTSYHDARRVVIDLHNIRYISSVAFRPLLSLRRKLQESGGRMVLCHLNTVVGDVFYTTRLISPTGEFAAPFEMAADVPAAIALLNTPPKS